MFRNSTFKILTNLILLEVLFTGQISSLPPTIENQHLLQFTVGRNFLPNEYPTVASEIQLNSSIRSNIYPNLVWNTFLGSYIEDTGYDIAAANNGNTYVVGTSNWNWGTPINPHADNCLNGCSNVFVAKLNSNGTLIWNTFFGSNQGSYGKKSV